MRLIELSRWRRRRERLRRFWRVAYDEKALTAVAVAVVAVAVAVVDDDEKEEDEDEDEDGDGDGDDEKEDDEEDEEGEWGLKRNVGMKFALNKGFSLLKPYLLHAEVSTGTLLPQVDHYHLQ